MKVNGVLKDFTPFWIDADGNLENDPYTSDCQSNTNSNNPHAYSEFTLRDGELISSICIEKPPGEFCFRFSA